LGYDDTSFFVGITEAELDMIGASQQLNGRSTVRRIMDAVAKLPRNIVPDTIPESLDEWLASIGLDRYMCNFQRFGYMSEHLPHLEGLEERELRQLGISRPGHLKKLKLAIAKLTQLLIKGRSPEGIRTLPLLSHEYHHTQVLWAHGWMCALAWDRPLSRGPP
jgi:hypothetical protein